MLSSRPYIWLFFLLISPLSFFQTILLFLLPRLSSEATKSTRIRKLLRGHEEQSKNFFLTSIQRENHEKFRLWTEFFVATQWLCHCVLHNKVRNWGFNWTFGMAMLFAWTPMSQKSICLIRRDENQFSFKFMLRCGLKRNSRCFPFVVVFGRREMEKRCCLFKGNDLIKESFPSSTQIRFFFGRRRFPLLFNSDLRYCSCVNGWLTVTSAHLTLHSAPRCMKYANFWWRHLTTASRAQKTSSFNRSPIETQKSNPTHNISCLKAGAQ